MKLPVPKFYHEELTAWYGDYMTPVQGAAQHDYPFYKKQMKLMEQNMALKKYGLYHWGQQPNDFQYRKIHSPERLPFDDVISNRKIFDKRYPQNFQLLLPLSYYYKIYTLEKTLFTIVVRLNSHSHRADNYEKHFEDFEPYFHG